MDEHVYKEQEHFWRIEDGGVRMCLFEGKDRAMLVDTGFGTLPVKDIVSELTKLPVFVVNTHTDMDHTGGNREFDRIYMHPAEMDCYVARGGAFEKDADGQEKIRPLWEGAVIDLGFWKFEVILTPGHTPGSIMLLDREKRLLISGDTIQAGDIYMFGPGRNLPAFRATLDRMDGMKGLFDTIWPSHGPCPLSPEIIPKLAEGAKALAEGKLISQDPPREGMPCRLYRCQAAGFLF